jgi:peptide/nickel transport system substrate-binding protein
MDSEGQEVEAAGAESWEISDDGLVYTFNLRPDLKFHDGSDVTASDVVWSLDRARDPEAGIWNWTLENVADVQAVDESTVEVILKQESAKFLSMLTMFNSSILPKEQYEDLGEEEFFKNPVGTGPFQVAEYIVADQITLEKNPHYWETGADGEPLPYLDTIEVVQVPEANTRVLQVQAGDIDGTDEVPLSKVGELEDDSDVNMRLFPSTRTQFGWLNHRMPPLDDVNVRKALNYAVDREALIDTVCYGYCEPATSFRARGTMCYNDELEGFPYDLERAKQLMAESDYPEGGDDPLLVTFAAGNSVTRDTTTVLEEMWAEIGIDVEAREMEVGAWYAEYDEEEFEVQIGSWTDDVVDPQQQTQYMAVSPAGRTGWENERVLELAEQAAVELDPEERCEMYREIQEIFNEEAVELILYHRPFTTLSSNAVQGFERTQLGWLVWKETWLEQ